jgi:hypothetical protein
MLHGFGKRGCSITTTIDLIELPNHGTVTSSY